MNSCEKTELARQLREVNVRLRFWLENLGPGASSGPATPIQINAVLDELLRAGAWLQSGFPSGVAQEDAKGEFEFEITEYRQHLEKLRELLPFIHSQLLQERARLEAERTRLDAAAEWASASRQSL